MPDRGIFFVYFKPNLMSFALVVPEQLALSPERTLCSKRPPHLFPRRPGGGRFRQPGGRFGNARLVHVQDADQADGLFISDGKTNLSQKISERALWYTSSGGGTVLC